MHYQKGEKNRDIALEVRKMVIARKNVADTEQSEEPRIGVFICR
ncbi:MAG: hypothetical protein ACXQS8_05605 [Candidatus Helarchaeales archaeon]